MKLICSSAINDDVKERSFLDQLIEVYGKNEETGGERTLSTSNSIVTQNGVVGIEKVTPCQIQKFLKDQRRLDNGNCNKSPKHRHKKRKSR